MGARRIAVIALSGALVAGGAGAAIAQVGKDDGEKAEQEVLADAAKRLNVTPEKLRDALAAAQDAQLDQAVEDGDLTRKQADALLERVDHKLKAIESGKPLRLRRHRGHRGMPPPGAMRPGAMLPGEEAPQLAPPNGTFS